MGDLEPGRYGGAKNVDPDKTGRICGWGYGFVSVAQDEAGSVLSAANINAKCDDCDYSCTAERVHEGFSRGGDPLYNVVIVEPPVELVKCGACLIGDCLRRKRLDAKESHERTSCLADDYELQYGRPPAKDEKIGSLGRGCSAKFYVPGGQSE